MIQFLLSLFKKSSPQNAKAPVRRLGIHLATIEGALLEEKGFPRPQWKIIRTWLKEHVAEEDIPIAWHEISCDWLNTLKKHLGSNYSVYQSSNFLLLTSQNLDISKRLLRTSELAAKELGKRLGDLSQKRGHGKHVILQFATEESYYDYVSYFYPPDSPLIASGGMFLNEGYQHIVIKPSLTTKTFRDTPVQHILIHELTHNRLAHLPIPRWLDEGLARVMERKISGNASGWMDDDLLKKHHNHWTSETIQPFWKGEAFNNMDGEITRLNYSLAEILVDFLMQDCPNHLEFIAQAHHQDAGQAAAEKSLGITLGDIAAKFLGPGDWTPKNLPPKDSRNSL